MLSLNTFSIFVPETRIAVPDLISETGLSKSVLSVYEMIYGLKTIPVWENDLQSLLRHPLHSILRDTTVLEKIKYVVYLHTAHWVSLQDDPIITFIAKNFSLPTPMIWESTLYKCVGFFKALELFSQLLKSPDELALILTGEIAFTPKLRVVPRSTIVGDAATASIISLRGIKHHLLSVKTKLILGYEKGIYLTDDELISFEMHFIAEIKTVIFEVLDEAGLTLNDISLLLPHNVNLPTWHKIAVALQFSKSKIYLKNIPHIGHSFCSDHLINLQSALNDSLLKPGDYYLMVGCALGFFVSAAVWRY